MRAHAEHGQLRLRRRTSAGKRRAPRARRRAWDCSKKSATGARAKEPSSAPPLARVLADRTGSKQPRASSSGCARLRVWLAWGVGSRWCVTFGCEHSPSRARRASYRGGSQTMAACLRGVGTRPQDIAYGDRTISGQGGMLESVRAAISVDISARATPVSRIVSGTLRSRGTSRAAIVTIERSFRSCAFACIAWLRLHPRYGRGCRRAGASPGRRVSEPSRATRRSLRSGWQHRYHRPHRRPGDVRCARRLLRGRQSCRRRWSDRLGPGRQGSARRLYAAGRLDRVHQRIGGALSESAL